MTSEERLTWVNATVTALVAVTYFVVVWSRFGSGSVASIPFQVPMLIAMGTIIVLTIVGAILSSIGAAVGAAVESKITGDDDRFHDAVAELDRKDERDVDIDQRGERVAHNVISGLLVGVLALAMLRVDQFWIANALFASFVVAGLAASIVKIVAYRRGF